MGDHKGTPVLPDVRSLSTPTVDGSPCPSSKPVSADDACSKCHTPLVLPSHCHSTSTRTVPRPNPWMNSSKSLTKTLISDQVSLSRTSTSDDQSSPPSQSTVTSDDQDSPGKSQRSSNIRLFC